MTTEENKNKRKTGSYGEDLASTFLKKLGYQIIERNYHYGHGEIDIIAKDGAELVFVEVKYRNNLNYGPPENSITPKKKNQIRKVSAAYLAERDLNNQPCRIDVITILKLPGKEALLNHYLNAIN